MGLLLDTHIFLWLTTDDKRLSSNARAAIEGAEVVFISAATIWEIAIKVRLGKMNGDVDELSGEIQNNGFEELSVYSRHAKEVARLPLLHSDPFDRLLIAQAMTEQLQLLTADRHLAAYSNLVITV